MRQFPEQQYSERYPAPQRMRVDFSNCAAQDLSQGSALNLLPSNKVVRLIVVIFSPKHKRLHLLSTPLYKQTPNDAASKILDYDSE